MYYIIISTRIRDGAVRMSVLKSEEEAKELMMRVLEENEKKILMQGPIEMEHIDFV